MVKSIYVGNLPFRLKREEIIELFETYGEVYSLRLINDKTTGRPKGFGFIEMDEKCVAQAIEALNGYECLGRKLIVNEARRKDSIKEDSIA